MVESRRPAYNNWPPEIWAIATSKFNEITKYMIRCMSDVPYEFRLLRAVEIFDAEPNVTTDDAGYFHKLAMIYALPDPALENLVASFDISFSEALEKASEYALKSPEEIKKSVEEMLNWS